MAEVRHLKRVVKSKSPDASPRPVPPSAAKTPETYAEDEGLVRLLMGLKFDPDNDASLNCPSCGEQVSIDRGMCPKCHELIRAKDPYALESQVLPLIDAKNVVYVHFDVASGDFKFIQRSSAMQKTELQEIHLDSPVFDAPDPLGHP